MDSGAFSAYTKGVEIDLPDYCRYILENDDILLKEDGILLASVLDGIGDPETTYTNQKEMERLGVRPLPCFHYGEDATYLEKYIKEYDYITLGGMVPISSQQLQIWLDRIWNSYLLDGSGRPRVRVHGFGLTTFSLMQRYPWYSVDSSSWVRSAMNGSISLFERGKLRALAVSVDSPTYKMPGQGFSGLPAIAQEAVRRMVEDRGYSLEQLSTRYQARWCFNLGTYADLSEQVKYLPPVFQPELF